MTRKTITVSLHSVLQDWMYTLPYRMQSVLMSSLRGCDTARKNDDSKYITRAIRALVLNNADPSNTFIIDGTPDESSVKSFLGDLDSYPVHFVTHTAHAAEIIGYKYPQLDTRHWWKEFYGKIVAALHLLPESQKQLDVRLGYTPTELKQLEESEHQWEAGTGSSHAKKGY